MFGTFFVFPCIYIYYTYIGNNHPNWLIFFRGVGLYHQPGMAHFIDGETMWNHHFSSCFPMKSLGSCELTIHGGCSATNPRGLWDKIGGYSNVYIAIENNHFFNGKTETHYKSQCSIVFCMFTRGYTTWQFDSKFIFIPLDHLRIYIYDIWYMIDTTFYKLDTLIQGTTCNYICSRLG